MLSVIFMTWMYRIIVLGRKRVLTGDDLYSLMEKDKAKNIANELEHCWADEMRSAARRTKKPRLWKALVQTFSLKLTFVLVTLRFVNSGCTLTLAVIVWYFLKVLGGSDMDYIAAIPYVVGISIAGFMKVFTDLHNSHQSDLKGMRLKVALIGLVYKKVF